MILQRNFNRRAQRTEERGLLLETFIGTAHAKLNLYLAVTGIREDGYHTLQTVFQEITLSDNLSLSRHRRGGISLRSNLHFIPHDERNLAYQAAALFFEESGIENTGLYINIRKNIPVGAGMAGGSTNAAAVLDILNRMYGRPFTRNRLKEIGLRLGADVPFCLEGGTVLAQGVGEEMQPLREMPPCWLVICRPSLSISTKTAFELLDGIELPPPPPVEPLVSALERGSLHDLCAGLHNCFEKAIFARYPKVARVKEEILSLGASGALMTGSGSAVFGIFPQMESAEKAGVWLRQYYRDAFVTRPI